MHYTKRINKCLQGIHPGKIIEWYLKKKRLSQGDLAERSGEHYQTINATIKRRKSLTVETSLKLDSFLGLDDGLLYMLQAYYELDQYKKAQFSSATGYKTNLVPRY